ncbi:MAG: transposase [Candidatus Synechococcus spongiarum 142]|uniref:Transposase n=1 Tax=Candidatus Synechococcus spongiarum 142 TaxID=1608213 RepID=A0A6N3X985_9SYNE|nr:MAG: transposase [Candidatus Synechococcus spongiarum 142]
MAHLFWRGERQLERIRLFFPKACGVSCGDESKVWRGIIHVLCYGLSWVDVPPVDGPYKTLCNRFRRWWHNGGFLLIFLELARSDGAEPGEVLMLDATHLKAYRTASSLKRG